jgi:hypothetical protein
MYKRSNYFASNPEQIAWRITLYEKWLLISPPIGDKSSFPYNDRVSSYGSAEKDIPLSVDWIFAPGRGGPRLRRLGILL